MGEDPVTEPSSQARKLGWALVCFGIITLPIPGAVLVDWLVLICGIAILVKNPSAPGAVTRSRATFSETSIAAVPTLGPADVPWASDDSTLSRSLRDEGRARALDPSEWDDWVTFFRAWDVPGRSYAEVARESEAVSESPVAVAAGRLLRLIGRRSGLTQSRADVPWLIRSAMSSCGASVAEALDRGLRPPPIDGLSRSQNAEAHHAWMFPLCMTLALDLHEPTLDLDDLIAILSAGADALDRRIDEHLAAFYSIDGPTPDWVYDSEDDDHQREIDERMEEDYACPQDLALAIYDDWVYTNDDSVVAQLNANWKRWVGVAPPWTPDDLNAMCRIAERRFLPPLPCEVCGGIGWLGSSAADAERCPYC